MKIKWAAIIFISLIVSYMHVSGSGGQMSTHLVHQQLFFIPIILTSFWFRIIPGLVVAALSSIVFSSVILIAGNGEHANPAVYSQVILYMTIAWLIGWLTTKFHLQQKQLIKTERMDALATLASALSFEIRDIVNSLELSLEETKESNTDIRQEIDRLDRLTSSFSTLIPSYDQPHIFQDLNDVLRTASKDARQLAKKRNIKIELDLDDASCPSMVFNNSMKDIFNGLIKNAMEVSTEGTKIVLKSRRAGTFCSLQVIDFGIGVKPEHVSKLFTPFFSTREGGHGLTLSSGKKVMRDYEGDLLYKPNVMSGSIFEMIVPRENRDINIDEYVTTTTKKLVIKK